MSSTLPFLTKVSVYCTGGQYFVPSFVVHVFLVEFGLFLPLHLPLGSSASALLGDLPSDAARAAMVVAPLRLPSPHPHHPPLRPSPSRRTRSSCFARSASSCGKRYRAPVPGAAARLPSSAFDLASLPAPPLHSGPTQRASACKAPFIATASPRLSGLGAPTARTDSPRAIYHICIRLHFGLP